MQRSDIPLVDIVDRLLDRGVVLAGGAGISVAGVDLIELRLNVVLAATDTFARTLDLPGRIELRLTLRWSAPRIAERATGASYLREKAAERRQAEGLVERLVADLAIDRALIRERICPQPGVAATVAITTTGGEEMSVLRIIERFARGTDEVTIDVAGATRA